MVFTSVGFVFAFLPVVLLGNALLRRTSWRNVWLLVTSLLFYAIGSGTVVLVLVVTTLVDWFLGARIGRARGEGDPRQVRALVTLSVVVNLATLGWFKYANFVTEDLLGPLAGLFGAPSPQLAAIALPIGISFFTFQRLSYVIDVARGEAEPLRAPQDLLLYIALFPQLIAGPIVRFTDIRHQIHERRLALEPFSAGAVRFAHGFAKKVLVADAVAGIADAGFLLPADQLTFAAAWLAVLAYTVQIYFDFSGYSDMAIGLGLMLGFDFPENFRRPYSAISITDFWRRWHITLSTWFRDYLYLPLGGSRSGQRATLRNLGIVFLLTGLWHGAAWTFVAWGAWHGVLLVAERLTGQRPVDAEGVNHLWLRRGLTFLAVVLGWVLFRAATFEQVLQVWSAMARPDVAALPSTLLAALDRRTVAMLVVGLATVVLPRDFVAGRVLTRSLVTQDAEPAAAARFRMVAGWQVATVLVVFSYALLLVVSGTFSPFLYFRF